MILKVLSLLSSSEYSMQCRSLFPMSSNDNANCEYSSSGLLIFAATVDLLAEDFLSDEAQLLMTKKMKTWAFTFVMMGAASMSVVGAFA